MVSSIVICNDSHVQGMAFVVLLKTFHSLEDSSKDNFTVEGCAKPFLDISLAVVARDLPSLCASAPC